VVLVACVVIGGGYSTVHGGTLKIGLELCALHTETPLSSKWAVGNALWYDWAMADHTLASQIRSQSMWMLIAAALFGYFGFGISWVHRYTTDSPPQLLIMVAVLMWTLRAGCVAFALSAVLAMAGSISGLLLYAVVGLLTSIAMLAVAVWDYTTPQYFSGVSPFLLLIFAAWNGYSSIEQLRTFAAIRRVGQ